METVLNIGGWTWTKYLSLLDVRFPLVIVKNKTTIEDNLYTIDLDSEEQGEGEGGEHHQQGHEGQQAGAHARALLARRNWNRTQD